MTIPEIVALATAGFTAQQIAALAAAPAAAPAAVPAPAPDAVQQLLTQMGALTQAVQASNIGAAAQPQPQTADDILAAIIAPPNLKKE